MISANVTETASTPTRRITATELAKGLSGRCANPRREALRLLRDREAWGVGTLHIHDQLINPAYLLPENVDVVDIARSLSQLCRFGGHVAVWYSVASHSQHVSALLPDRLKLAGLLHDAAKAYLGADIPGPLKSSPLLASLRDLEHYVGAIVSLRFNLRLTPSDWLDIMRADRQALYDEGYSILHYAPTQWPGTVRPSAMDIRPEDPYNAQLSFLARFTTLTQHHKV